jgi:IS5 family transposase
VQGHSDLNRALLDTAALCRQLVPDSSVEAFLADHRLELFPDEMFADLFPSSRGRPSVPADVVASVMVLQALEGLSDRDAASALRDRISWKVACGLAVDDEGFDYTVLTYWRTRLRKSKEPERIFIAVRTVVHATGVLAGKTRRALDSTLLDDAVATQDTVTQLIAAIRRVRRVVPGASEVSLSGDYQVTGKPAIAWDDPEAKVALIDSLVTDALGLLEACRPGRSVEADEALGLLALVAGQDVWRDEDGTWRVAHKVAPERVVSTVDPESRHMHKSTSEYRDGYKAHLAVEPESGIVTAATLTAANAPDGSTGVTLLASEEPGLQILADGAYGSGEVLRQLTRSGHAAAIKPYPGSSGRPGLFGRDDFTVDEVAGTATCPAGQTVTITSGRAAVFGFRCRSCPLLLRCTTSKRGRILRLHHHDALLVESRRAWRDGDFIDDYRRWRPMVERSIAWLVANGHRRVRFRGIERNRLGLSTRVAAINLRRLVNLGLDHQGGWVLA